MMLDVLFKIKDEQDSSVSFRRSCRYEDYLVRAVLMCDIPFSPLTDGPGKASVALVR